MSVHVRGMFTVSMVYSVHVQDVFTVSVGNLPPNATVLIKITYVAELQVEAELISFRLPGSVAPWKEDTATKDKTQVGDVDLSVQECVCVCVCVLSLIHI